MADLPGGARDFLKQGALAHVVTLEPDGTPHVSLAWAGADDDGLVWSSFFDQHKLDNLRRDPRITLSFQAHESGGERLHPYLVISGRAHKYYLGPGERYPWREAPGGFTVTVAIDKVYGQGSWREADDRPHR